MVLGRAPSQRLGPLSSPSPNRALAAAVQTVMRRSTSSSDIDGWKSAAARSSLQLLTTLPRPTARPARSAEPSAVVSIISGRTIGTLSTSAWNCIGRVLARAAVTLRPGSLRGPPPWPGGCRRTEARFPRGGACDVGAGHPAIQTRDHPGLRPPVGAPRPVRAGTKVTPPLSGTCRPAPPPRRRSRSARAHREATAAAPQ